MLGHDVTLNTGSNTIIEAWNLISAYYDAATMTLLRS